MLAARGIGVAYETVRQWGRKFGKPFSPAGHFKFLRVWSVKFLHPRGRTRDC
ncbi:hypothetical protein AB7M74_002577 [Bradyrhizobium japonicum]